MLLHLFVFMSGTKGGLKSTWGTRRNDSSPISLVNENVAVWKPVHATLTSLLFLNGWLDQFGQSPRSSNNCPFHSFAWATPAYRSRSQPTCARRTACACNMSPRRSHMEHSQEQGTCVSQVCVAQVFTHKPKITREGYTIPLPHDR